MKQQKKDAENIKAKYNYTSVDDFQYHGFKIRPPVREKEKVVTRAEEKYLSTY